MRRFGCRSNSAAVLSVGACGGSTLMASSPSSSSCGGPLPSNNSVSGVMLQQSLRASSSIPHFNVPATPTPTSVCGQRSTGALPRSTSPSGAVTATVAQRWRCDGCGMWNEDTSSSTADVASRANAPMTQRSCCFVCGEVSVGAQRRQQPPSQFQQPSQVGANDSSQSKEQRRSATAAARQHNHRYIKDASPPRRPSSSSPSIASPAPTKGPWKCAGCKSPNEADANECFACGGSKMAQQQQTTPQPTAAAGNKAQQRAENIPTVAVRQENQLQNLQQQQRKRGDHNHGQNRRQRFDSPSSGGGTPSSSPSTPPSTPPSTTSPSSPPPSSARLIGLQEIYRRTRHCEARADALLEAKASLLRPRSRAFFEQSCRRLAHIREVEEEALLQMAKDADALLMGRGSDHKQSRQQQSQQQADSNSSSSSNQQGAASVSDGLTDSTTNSTANRAEDDKHNQSRSDALYSGPTSLFCRINGIKSRNNRLYLKSKHMQAAKRAQMREDRAAEDRERRVLGGGGAADDTVIVFPGGGLGGSYEPISRSAIYGPPSASATPQQQSVAAHNKVTSVFGGHSIEDIADSAAVGRVPTEGIAFNNYTTGEMSAMEHASSSSSSALHVSSSCPSSGNNATTAMNNGAESISGSNGGITFTPASQSEVYAAALDPDMALLKRSSAINTYRTNRIETLADYLSRWRERHEALLQGELHPPPQPLGTVGAVAETEQQNHRAADTMAKEGGGGGTINAAALIDEGLAASIGLDAVVAPVVLEETRQPPSAAEAEKESISEWDRSGTSSEDVWGIPTTSTAAAVGTETFWPTASAWGEGATSSGDGWGGGGTANGGWGSSSSSSTQQTATGSQTTVAKPAPLPSQQRIAVVKPLPYSTDDAAVAEAKVAVVIRADKKGAARGDNSTTTTAATVSEGGESPAAVVDGGAGTTQQQQSGVQQQDSSPFQSKLQRRPFSGSSTAFGKKGPQTDAVSDVNGGSGRVIRVVDFDMVCWMAEAMADPSEVLEDMAKQKVCLSSGNHLFLAPCIIESESSVTVRVLPKYYLDFFTHKGECLLTRRMLRETAHAFYLKHGIPPTMDPLFVGTVDAREVVKGELLRRQQQQHQQHTGADGRDGGGLLADGNNKAAWAKVEQMPESVAKNRARATNKAVAAQLLFEARRRVAEVGGSSGIWGEGEPGSQVAPPQQPAHDAVGDAATPSLVAEGSTDFQSDFHALERWLTAPRTQQKTVSDVCGSANDANEAAATEYQSMEELASGLNGPYPDAEASAVTRQLVKAFFGEHLHPQRSSNAAVTPSPHSCGRRDNGDDGDQRVTAEELLDFDIRRTAIGTVVDTAYAMAKRADAERRLRSGGGGAEEEKEHSLSNTDGEEGDHVLPRRQKAPKKVPIDPLVLADKLSQCRELQKLPLHIFNTMRTLIERRDGGSSSSLSSSTASPPPPVEFGTLPNLIDRSHLYATAPQYSIQTYWLGGLSRVVPPNRPRLSLVTMACLHVAPTRRATTTAHSHREEGNGDAHGRGEGEVAPRTTDEGSAAVTGGANSAETSTGIASSESADAVSGTTTTGPDGGDGDALPSVLLDDSPANAALLSDEALIRSFVMTELHPRLRWRCGHCGVLNVKPTAHTALLMKEAAKQQHQGDNNTVAPDSESAQQRSLLDHALFNPAVAEGASAAAKIGGGGGDGGVSIPAPAFPWDKLELIGTSVPGLGAASFSGPVPSSSSSGASCSCCYACGTMEADGVHSFEQHQLRTEMKAAGGGAGRRRHGNEAQRHGSHHASDNAAGYHGAMHQQHAGRNNNNSRHAHPHQQQAVAPSDGWGAPAESASSGWSWGEAASSPSTFSTPPAATTVANHFHELSSATDGLGQMEKEQRGTSSSLSSQQQGGGGDDGGTSLAAKGSSSSSSSSSHHRRHNQQPPAVNDEWAISRERWTSADDKDHVGFWKRQRESRPHPFRQSALEARRRQQQQQDGNGAEWSGGGGAEAEEEGQWRNLDDDRVLQYRSDDAAHADLAEFIAAKADQTVHHLSRTSNLRHQMVPIDDAYFRRAATSNTGLGAQGGLSERVRTQRFNLLMRTVERNVQVREAIKNQQDVREVLAKRVTRRFRFLTVRDEAGNVLERAHNPHYLGGSQERKAAYEAAMQRLKEEEEAAAGAAAHNHRHQQHGVRREYHGVTYEDSSVRSARDGYYSAYQPRSAALSGALFEGRGVGGDGGDSILPGVGQSNGVLSAILSDPDLQDE